MSLTDADRARWTDLRSLRAWTPEFIDLDRRIASEASDAWRKADVFGCLPGYDEATGEPR